MMDRRHDEEENMVALYEASRNGCVSTLTPLIQRDAHILDRVSLTSFSETPLHLSALHGHLEFSRVLISKKPTLAKEVDSLGRTPLHLASAEGHTEIVKALLQANKNICSAVDQYERIPLHLASMRGHIEIIKELVIARQESIRVNLNGESVFHLCLRYNHLDALKLLVESANGDELFLKSKDHDGNSILHLAVMLKQMKVRYQFLWLSTPMKLFKIYFLFFIPFFRKFVCIHKAYMTKNLDWRIDIYIYIYIYIYI
jgi:ankyrin repeat protein